MQLERISDPTAKKRAEAPVEKEAVDEKLVFTPTADADAGAVAPAAVAPSRASRASVKFSAHAPSSSSVAWSREQSMQSGLVAEPLVADTKSMFDESSSPPLPLSRGSTALERMSRADLSEASIEAISGAGSLAGGAGGVGAVYGQSRRQSSVRMPRGGSGAPAGSEDRAYADLLTLRCIIRRDERVYSVAPNEDCSKLVIASRDRLVAMFELPDRDEADEDSKHGPNGGAAPSTPKAGAAQRAADKPRDDDGVGRGGSGAGSGGGGGGGSRGGASGGGGRSSENAGWRGSTAGLDAGGGVGGGSPHQLARAEAVGLRAELRWEKRTDDLVYSVALSTDERVCAFGGRSMSVMVVDAVSGRQLFSVPTSGSIWSVRLLDYSPTPAAMPQLKLLYGGEFPHLCVIDVASRNQELHMPVAEGTYGLDLTPQALAYTNGTRASVYGKAGNHFAWHDPPSFQYISRLLLKQQHRLTTDAHVELIRLVVQRHPAVVNLQDSQTGVSLVQLAVEGSCHPRIVDCMLRVSCRVGLQPNLRGLTALDTALQLGDAAALRALLAALLSGRFAPTPNGMRLVTDAFEALASKYPHEFLHFVSAMPLQSEPEIFLTETQNVRLPHTRPFLVGGDEARCPMGLWEDVLHKHRMEFQDELAGLLQQVASRHGEESSQGQPGGSSGLGGAGGVGLGATLADQAERTMSRVRCMALAQDAADRAAAFRQSIGTEGGGIDNSSIKSWQVARRRLCSVGALSGKLAKTADGRDGGGGGGGASASASSGEMSERGSEPGILAGVSACRRASAKPMTNPILQPGPDTSEAAASSLAEPSSFASRPATRRVPASALGGGDAAAGQRAMGGQVRQGFVRVQSGGLQALRIPFEFFAGDPRISKSILDSAGYESRPSPLELVVRAVNATQTYKVFDSTPIKILLTYKWIGFARREFYNDLALFSLHLAATVAFIIMSSRKYDIWLSVLLEAPADPENVVLVVFWSLTTVTSIFNLVWIFARRHLKKGILTYVLSDSQVLVNVLYNLGQVIVNCWLLVLVCFLNGPSTYVKLVAGNATSPRLLYNLTVIERVAMQIESRDAAHDSFSNPAVNVCQALVCMLLFTRMIFYFRGFISFGALVFIVFEVVRTMFPFFLFLFVLVIGMSVAMKVLMQHIYPDEEAWSDTVRPLFYLLNYGLRFAPPNSMLLDTASERPFLGLVYFLYMGCVQLILSNLLVAIMSNRLGQLRGNERLMASHVRAKLVLDLEQGLLSRILDSAKAAPGGASGGGLFRRMRSSGGARNGRPVFSRLVLLVSRVRSRVRSVMHGLEGLVSLIFSQEKLPELNDVRPRWLHVLMPTEQAAAEATSSYGDVGWAGGDGRGGKAAGGTGGPGGPLGGGANESARLLAVERTLEELRQAVDRGNSEVVTRVIGAVEKAIDEKFGQAEEAAQDQMTTFGRHAVVGGEGGARGGVTAGGMHTPKAPRSLSRQRTQGLSSLGGRVERIPGTNPSPVGVFGSFMQSIFSPSEQEVRASAACNPAAAATPTAAPGRLPVPNGQSLRTLPAKAPAALPEEPTSMQQSYAPSTAKVERQRAPSALAPAAAGSSSTLLSA